MTLNRQVIMGEYITRNSAIWGTGHQQRCQKRNRRRAPERELARAACFALLFALFDIATYIRHPNLMRRYRRRMGRWPRPSLPRDYHERLLWRKIHDLDPRFPQWADKLAAKQLVAHTAPDLAVAETLWQGDDPDAIPDDVLAGDCVVKANHGCGWNVIVRDGQVDRAALARDCSPVAAPPLRPQQPRMGLSPH